MTRPQRRPAKCDSESLEPTAELGLVMGRPGNRLSRWFYAVEAGESGALWAGQGSCISRCAARPSERGFSDGRVKGRTLARPAYGLAYCPPLLQARVCLCAPEAGRLDVLLSFAGAFVLLLVRSTSMPQPATSGVGMRCWPPRLKPSDDPWAWNAAGLKIRRELGRARGQAKRRGRWHPMTRDAARCERGTLA